MSNILTITASIRSDADSISRGLGTSIAEPARDVAEPAARRADTHDCHANPLVRTGRACGARSGVGGSRQPVSSGGGCGKGERAFNETAAGQRHGRFLLVSAAV